MINCLRVSLFEEAVSRFPPQRLGVYIAENQPWEMALVYAWKAAGHGILIGTPHTTVRFWDLRYHYDARSYLSDNDNGLPLPDIWAVNGPAAQESVLASGYPPDRVIEVEALRFLHLLRPRRCKIASHKPRPELHVLVCGDFLAETNRRILSWLENAAKSLPRETVYVFKPHPAYPLNPSDYPALNLEMSEAPLADLLADCDVVFTSNITSAAVVAYCSGIPVIQTLDGKTFNMSPLRGMEGAVYVQNPMELADALGKAKHCKRIVAEPYFCLDEALPRWQKLLGAECNAWTTTLG
jgi:surface carbohydrate biosynthesis protein (TIGR04326 family)